MDALRRHTWSHATAALVLGLVGMFAHVAAATDDDARLARSRQTLAKARADAAAMIARLDQMYGELALLDRKIDEALRSHADCNRHITMRKRQLEELRRQQREAIRRRDQLSRVPPIRISEACKVHVLCDESR